MALASFPLHFPRPMFGPCIEGETTSTKALLFTLIVAHVGPIAPDMGIEPTEQVGQAPHDYSQRRDCACFELWNLDLLSFVCPNDLDSLGSSDSIERDENRVGRSGG